MDREASNSSRAEMLKVEGWGLIVIAGGNYLSLALLQLTDPND
jgi:hypothetical protein